MTFRPTLADYRLLGVALRCITHGEDARIAFPTEEASKRWWDWARAEIDKLPAAHPVNAPLRHKSEGRTRGV